MSVIESPRSWRGLVLSAPYFGLALDVPAAKKIAGRIASRLAPRLMLPTGLKGSDLTHDAVRAREHDEDPLVFPNATARWFRESTKAQARALAQAGSLTLPLFEVFGTADPVAKSLQSWVENGGVLLCLPPGGEETSGQEESRSVRRRVAKDTSCRCRKSSRSASPSPECA